VNQKNRDQKFRDEKFRDKKFRDVVKKCIKLSYFFQFLVAVVDILLDFINKTNDRQVL
jgi:hypothetical protein